jgi:hypothetical protein
MREIAKTLLPKGSALRLMRQDENNRFCEVYTYSGWQRLDADWAKELQLTYGNKARKFIQKHIPELLD